MRKIICIIVSPTHKITTTTKYFWLVQITQFHLEEKIERTIRYFRLLPEQPGDFSFIYTHIMKTIFKWVTGPLQETYESYDLNYEMRFDRTLQQIETRFRYQYPIFSFSFHTRNTMNRENCNIVIRAFTTNTLDKSNLST
jgi:hypothetical protein